MTREARRSFRISNLNLQELNFTLGLIADRMDEMEGRRGTPQFKNNVDMGSNRITSVGEASESNDAISLGDATTTAATAATSAATSAVQTALTPLQNWVTYHRIVDATFGTIIHGFNVI